MELRRLLLACVSTGFLWSCGPVTDTPTNSSAPGAGVGAASTDVTAIAFSLPGAPRLSKTSAKNLETRFTSEDVEIDDDAKLEVSFDREDENSNPSSAAQGVVRVRKASIEIHEESIGGSHAERQDEIEITMNVQSGLALSDVLVQFTPSGLTFRPTALLSVQLSGHLAPTEIIVYHIYSDGTVVEILTEIVQDGDYWRVNVDVPGFSEYSWDDGDP